MTKRVEDSQKNASVRFLELAVSRLGRTNETTRQRRDVQNCLIDVSNAIQKYVWYKYVKRMKKHHRWFLQVFDRNSPILHPFEI